MKRKITSVTTAIIVLFLMLITLPEKGWGQTRTDYEYTFTATTYTANNQSQTLSDVSWKLDGTYNGAGYWGYDGTRGQQFGASNKQYSSLTLTTSGILGTITKIEVYASTGSSATATISCTVNGNAFGTQSQSLTTSNSKYTFSPDSGSSGTIVISMSQPSTTKALYIKSIKVTYTTGSLINITYDKNNVSATGSQTDATNYVSGASVTIKNKGTLALTSYGFTAWSKNIDGSGKRYYPNDTLIIRRATTLYAIWSTPYTVTYDANGANSGSVPTDSNNPYGDGARVTVLGNTGSLVKTNCVFEGWTIAGSETIYTSDATFFIEGNTTLYAKWRELATYALVTKDNPVEPGKHYIIASSKDNGGAYAMGAQKSNNRYAVPVTVSSSIITEPVVDDENMSGTTLYEFVISGPEVISNTNYYTFYDNDVAELNETSTKTGFLNAPGGGNNLRLLSPESLSDNGRWTIGINETNSVATIVSKTVNKQKNLRYNSSKLFSCYESGQSDVYLYKKVGDNDCEIYSATKIEANKTVTGNMKINAGVVTVAENKTLTVNGTLTNSGTVANLIIEDGGQLITTSAVSATVKHSIDAVPTKDDVYGWYTISSPVNGVNITDNTNLLDNTYNILRYNEEEMVWENYGNPAYSSFGNTLENGRGYLYRNSDDITLEYSGTINNSTVAYTVTKHDVEYEGFNLIGNPYTHDIYKGTGGAVPNTSASGYELANGFYTLTKAAEWHACEDNVDAIKSGQGFLVKATTGGEIVMSNVATGGPAKGRANHDNIKFVVENNQYSDVAYAVFDKGYGLNKINHRNPNSPMIYIPRVDDNYAIAMMNDDTKSFDLNFKAMIMGQYTLSLKANGMFDYIHLIDRLTGKDIDMLLEGKYTFIGTPSDSDNRFIVKLAYNTGNTSSMDESFAYQSGNDIYVTGSGELQIFDITGRQVMATTISGTESINLSAKGVFIFRLIGNDVKTQKIVVE